MKVFSWDVQYFCPLSCQYCYSNSGPSRPQTTSDELWRVARAIAREKPDAVMISGGEPTLAKGIHEVAAYLRENGIVLSLFTSGWGMTESRIRALANAFDRIHVSFDSADPSINDHLRGKVGAHANATNTLHLLGEQKKQSPRLRFGVDCTIVTTNLAGVDDFCEFLATIDGLTFINIAPAAPTGRAAGEGFPLLLSESQIAWLLDQTQRLRELLPRSVTLNVHRNDSLKTELESHVHLNANGDVRAIKICEATIGNIVNEPLDTLLMRAGDWRSSSQLARSLPVVKDFVAWREIVREIDHQAKSNAASAFRNSSDDTDVPI